MSKNENVKQYTTLTEIMREWLRVERGLSDEIITRFRLAYDGQSLVIPIWDREGNYIFNKYRCSPLLKTEGPKYVFDKGATAQIYGWEHINTPKASLVICEGEFDRLVLETHQIAAITGTNGAPTFKDEWVDIINTLDSEVFICMDNDYAGLKAAEKLSEKLPNAKLIEIPEEDNIKDITDFVKKYGIEKFKDLMQGAKSLRTIKEEKRALLWNENKEKFPPIKLSDLVDILGVTIKKDDTNKIITFLCQLSAYTEESQFNVSFNAPSSTGKSYIPLEISALFPDEDLKIIGYSSPTAFYHDGEVDPKTGIVKIDLSRKILIFLDQPKPDLLERLRPLLSHDQKVMNAKITDRTKNVSSRTKNVAIKGFPSVVFCSAGLRIDEQESSRFILLSPEMSQEKIREGVFELIRKDCNLKEYKKALCSNRNRTALMERIRAIKQASIEDINILETEQLRALFSKPGKALIAKNQRDVKRIISFIKMFALLNLWHRQRSGADITASNEDIAMGLELWSEISRSQELNLPPYVYNFYMDIIKPACNEQEEGLTRQDIIRKHYTVYGRLVSEWQLGREVIPMLEMAGLIVQEQDPADKRRRIIKLVCKEESAAEGSLSSDEDQTYTRESLFFTDETNIDQGVYVTQDAEDTIPF
jgi:5S rRNA maturation endonuclease (ribonuclease M5)